MDEEIGQATVDEADPALNGEEPSKPAAMTIIAEAAKELKSAQEHLTDLRSEVKEWEKKQAQFSNSIVEEANKMGGEKITEGILIKDVGMVKITTKPHPGVQDVDAFILWCSDKQQNAPPLSINAKVMQSWFSEQGLNSLPIPPEELVRVHWSTTARVRKG